LTFELDRQQLTIINLFLGKNCMFNSTKSSLFAFLAVSIFSFPVFAQDSNSDNAEAEDSQVEEIIILGSRIARDPLDLAQPVTIISGEEYELRAYTNAASALTDIPGVGSVNSLSGDQGGLGAGQQIAANFGLGSSRTVTLVNGRRFVGSQSPVGGAGSGLAVDLNNIPSALIDRVEILPVGGAAIYGADAIAGVVNFVLKEDYEGAEFTYKWSRLCWR
jgi:iron complex outermembrane receptor protein